MSLADAAALLGAGIPVNEAMVTAERSPGRFPEEERLTVFLTSGDTSERLLTATVYHGWNWYAPWAELSRITPHLDHEGQSISYYDSPVEACILTLFADAIQPPGHLFVSYETDQETARALNRGVPPPVTRLGYQLFIRDFTWFKDWYHPEGWMEGGQKLQAEKALDAEHRQRHHEAIQEEIKDFLATDDTEGTAAARERARSVLGCLDI
ncbi:MAG: DUF1122 family protein [Thermoplasmatota archaeon]